MPTRSDARIVVGLLTLLFNPFRVAIAAAQHGKIDHVELDNGNRVTCEIQKLVRAELTVKTDGLGTVSIEWNRVVSVGSPAYYEVVLASGVRQYGTLASPSPGLLQIGTATPVSIAEVVTIAPVETGFWHRLDGSISAGYSYTQANNRTQLTLDTDVTVRTKTIVTRLAFDSLVAVEEGTDTENRQTLSVNVTRNFGRIWYGSALGQLSRNDALSLDYRSVTGGVWGRWFVQSNLTLLSAFSGVAYTRERYTGEPTANHAELVIGLRWDRFTFGDRATDIRTTSMAFVDLKTAIDSRAELDATLSHKIVKDLQVSVSLFESFNSTPPEGEKNNDFGVTVSFGWTF